MLFEDWSLCYKDGPMYRSMWVEYNAITLFQMGMMQIWWGLQNMHARLIQCSSSAHEVQ